jgi:formylmethanofuran dehydrogenase subunit D
MSTITIKYEANPEWEERTGTLTFTGAEGSTATVTLKQSARPKVITYVECEAINVTGGSLAFGATATLRAKVHYDNGDVVTKTAADGAIFAVVTGSPQPAADKYIFNSPSVKNNLIRSTVPTTTYSNKVISPATSATGSPGRYLLFAQVSPPDSAKTQVTIKGTAKKTVTYPAVSSISPEFSATFGGVSSDTVYSGSKHNVTIPLTPQDASSTVSNVVADGATYTSPGQDHTINIGAFNTVGEALVKGSQDPVDPQDYPVDITVKYGDVEIGKVYLEDRGAAELTVNNSTTPTVTITYESGSETVTLNTNNTGWSVGTLPDWVTSVTPSSGTN